PPRGGVGQRLQRDERTLDRFRPRPDIRTPTAPLPPERLAARQGVEGIDRWWGISKRGSIGEDKGNGLVSLDRELADCSEIFAVECNRGSQQQTLWAGNRADRSVIEP